MTSGVTPQLVELGGEAMWELLLIGPGPRPTTSTDDLLRDLHRGLWSHSLGTDSEGDWDEAEPMSEWRYWYQAMRPEGHQYFIVEAIGDDPLTFSINATSQDLCAIVAHFMHNYCGGELVMDAELALRLRSTSP